MKIGLALWADQDLATLGELAQAAEDAGFVQLWWPDHYNAREIGATLTTSVARTGRLRLGTAVTSPLLRHPAMLASLFATLSEASGGRIMAGFGPGGFEVKTELSVIPKSPLRAMREAVTVFRALIEGKPVTMENSAVFPVREAQLGFQAPPVPVFLAGRGPRMIELAGEVADGVITHGLARPYLELVAERVRSGAHRAKRSPKECTVTLMCEIAIDDDIERARDVLRPHCLYAVGGEYAEELIPLYGLDPAAVTRVRRAVRARDSQAIDLVTDDMVDAFCVAGPVEHVAERLAELEEHGVPAVILDPGQGLSVAGVRRLGKAVERMSI